LRTLKSYIESRNLSSPVQRHNSATALGNFTVSSVLPALWFEPKYTSPVGTTSCATLPLRLFSRSLMSRSARKCSFTVSN
jgi:hypothetical protein